MRWSRTVLWGCQAGLIYLAFSLRAPGWSFELPPSPGELGGKVGGKKEWPRFMGPMALAPRRNVTGIFGPGSAVNSNSWRAFEAGSDRGGHCRNKSVIHPVKLGVCVRQAAEVPHLIGRKLILFYPLVHACTLPRRYEMPAGFVASVIVAHPRKLPAAIETTCSSSSRLCVCHTTI